MTLLQWVIRFARTIIDLFFGRPGPFDPYVDVRQANRRGPRHRYGAAAVTEPAEPIKTMAAAKRL